MVNEGIQSAFFSGEIPVKGFSGEASLGTEVTDRNILISDSSHHFQQLLLHFPLTKGRVLGFAQFIHYSPSFGMFLSLYAKFFSKASNLLIVNKLLLDYFCAGCLRFRDVSPS
jgi:hypothetical protein